MPAHYGTAVYGTHFARRGDYEILVHGLTQTACQSTKHRKTHETDHAFSSAPNVSARRVSWGLVIRETFSQRLYGMSRPKLVLEWPSFLEVCAVVLITSPFWAAAIGWLINL